MKKKIFVVIIVIVLLRMCGMANNKVITIRYGQDTLDYMEFVPPFYVGKIVAETEITGQTFTPSQVNELEQGTAKEKFEKEEKVGDLAHSIYANEVAHTVYASNIAHSVDATDSPRVPPTRANPKQRKIDIPDLGQ